MVLGTKRSFMYILIINNFPSTFTVITGHYTSGTIGSFYDPCTGELKTSMLQSILAKKGVINFSGYFKIILLSG